MKNAVLFALGSIFTFIFECLHCEYFSVPQQKRPLGLIRKAR